MYDTMIIVTIFTRRIEFKLTFLGEFLHYIFVNIYYSIKYITILDTFQYYM